MIRVKHQLMLALFALSAVLGCGLLKPASPKAERFECQVRALQPAVGDVRDARQLLLDVYAGKADLASALHALKATQAEVEALVKALAACEPTVKLPEGSAS